MLGLDEREVFDYLRWWEENKKYKYTREESEISRSCVFVTLGYQSGVGGLLGVLTGAAFRARFRGIPLTNIGPMAAIGVSMVIGGQLGWALAMPKCLSKLVNETPTRSPIACQACLFMKNRGGVLGEAYRDVCNRHLVDLP